MVVFAVLLSVVAALSDFGEHPNGVVLAVVNHDGSLAESDEKPHVRGASPHKALDPVGTPTFNGSTVGVDSDDLPFTFDWHHLEMMRNKASAMRKATGEKHGPTRVFLHIHKNAGTFLCGLAQKMGETVHPKAVPLNCNLGFDDYHTGPGEALAKSCGSRESELLQGGATYAHVEQPAFANNAQCAGATYVVTLRDPIARICSHSRMSVTSPGDDSFDTMFEMGGAAYLKEKIKQGARAGSGWRQAWQFLDNYQVRVLAPAFDVPAGKIDDSHLAKAKATLSKMHVGVLEDYKKAADVISSAFGWPKFASSMRPQHTYPSCVNGQFGSESDLNELRKLNKYDMALLESVKGH